MKCTLIETVLCNPVIYNHLPSENCALTWRTVYYCMHQKQNKDIDHMEPWFILSDSSVFFLFYEEHIWLGTTVMDSSL